MKDELTKLIKQFRGSLELYIQSGIDTFYKHAPLVSNGKRDKQLEELKHKAVNCKNCLLYRTRTNVVFGEGNQDARLVFVGEAPGEEEDLQGLPFVGQAGKLLTKIIESMGLARADVYICNIIKCRPPHNRQPLLDEIEKCKPYLSSQLDIIKPEIICTLGRYAALALLKKDEPISRIRGNFYMYNGAKVMPTFHPSYLLRNPKDKKLVWQDMKKIMCLLK